MPEAAGGGEGASEDPAGSASLLLRKCTFCTSRGSKAARVESLQTDETLFFCDFELTAHRPAAVAHLGAGYTCKPSGPTSDLQNQNPSSQGRGRG